MAKPPMSIDTAALIGDTLHMTASEFGAYMLILVAMWNAGGSLPSDDGTLCRISRMGQNNWPRVRPRVLALLSFEGDRVTQKRLRDEFQKVAAKRSRVAANGRAGGARKAEILLAQREEIVLAQREEIVLAQREGLSGVKPLKMLDAPLAGLDENSEKNTSPASAARAITHGGVRASAFPVPVPVPATLGVLEEKETSSPKRKSVLQKRGTRIPLDWEPSDDDRMYAASKGLSPARVDREAEAFRNYWMAAPGERGVKVDWPATWRNWCLNAVERRPETTPKVQPTGWSLPAQSPGRRT